MATSSSPNRTSDHLTLDCDVCKYQGLSSQAVSFCDICTEYLCQTCDRVHRAAKQSRNHIPVIANHHFAMASDSDEDGQMPAVMMCDNHQQPIQYFCKKDDSVFCNICKLTSHRSCDTSDLGTPAAEAKANNMFVNFKRTLIDLEQRYEELKTKRANDKGLLKSQVQACFDELMRIKQDINDILDDIEKKMQDEVNNVEEELSKEIDEHLIITDDTLRKIRDSIKLLEDGENTHQDDAKFVAMKKAGVILSDYKNATANLKMATRDVYIRTKHRDRLKRCLEGLCLFGELTQGTSFLDLTLAEGRIDHADGVDVHSVTFLSDGHAVLACYEDGLKLLNRHFQLKCELPMRVISVCKISDTEVLTSHGKQRNVQVVEVLPTMVKKKEIQVGRGCTGIDYCNNEIYVTCHDNPGLGEVRVLDMEGQLQRRLGFDGQKYMFAVPCDVKVSRNCDKVIVADQWHDSVTCLDQQGRVIYRYTDKELRTPVCLMFDVYDNVLVCGARSRNIHAISSSKKGKRGKILQMEKGVVHPICISYRQSDGCLAVGVHGNDKRFLITYTTKTSVADT